MERALAVVGGGLLELVKVSSGDRVLEVGHGAGGLVRDLDRHTGARQLCGVDLSPDMPRLARRHNRQGRIDRVLARTFDRLARHELANLTVFEATR
ncbi:class I SAM-dependent methyltransferase [Nonomuraea angiospora]|uniref:class I SAM-dependent methyltransferase n=1 Tax=Nonomuraea angiospora TaxID=46172 RepID=UPI00344B501F